MKTRSVLVVLGLLLAVFVAPVAAAKDATVTLAISGMT